jgi:hypothetical protein
MTDATARAYLLELAQISSPEDYISLIWASRYPHPSPASSSGWPFKPSCGVEQPSKLRKVK